MRCHLRLPIVFFTTISAIASFAQAAPVSYTLDPAQSILNATATINGLLPLLEQGPGSLSTTYSGNINADLEPGQIEILGGAPTAANSGSWVPDSSGTPNSELANYGAYFDFGIGQTYGAVRGFSLQTLGTPQAIVFDAFALPNIEILSGVLDHLDVVFGTPSFSQEPLGGTYTNTAAVPASLFSDGVTETLTIPVKFLATLPLNEENNLHVELEGTLVGTRAVPEPATGLLLAGGALIVFKRKRFPNSC